MSKRIIIILFGKDVDNTEKINYLSKYIIIILSGEELDYNNKYNNISLYIREDLDILILYAKAREESQEDDINYYFF